MLLIRRFQTARGEDPERGSALLAVIGVMAVAAIIAVVIVSMSMHSIGYTTSTRATVQARAAAEAGADSAAANIAGSVCQSSYSSSTAPAFSVTVSYSTAATPPQNTTDWMSGCPTSVAAKWIKLVSRGTAADPGLVGNSSGDVRTVEAIYPYTPTPPTSGVPVSGAALYSSDFFDSTLTNFTVNPGNPVPYVEILSGDIQCNTKTTIYANIILGSGAVSTGPQCTINGDLYSAGGVDVQGEVKGNVYSTGTTGPTISVGALVDGSVYSANGAVIDGRVHGNVISGPGGADVSGRGIVDGTVTTAGVVSGITINGAPASIKVAGIVTPVIPNVPPWADYTYNPTFWTWTQPDGTIAQFTVVTLTAMQCASASTVASTIGAALTPTIVDTRACTSLTNIQSLTLQTDIVVIANGLKIGSSAPITIKSRDSTLHKLWLIVPDAGTAPNHFPNCPPLSGGVSIGNNTVVNSPAQGNPVAAMLYSPCPITNNGFDWNGQLYVASINSNSDVKITANPLGLPGQNLDTGDTTTPGFPGTGVLGDRTGMRDLAGG